MKTKGLFFLLFLFCLTTLHAGTVHTVQVYSESMNRNIDTQIVTPDKEGSFPVIYLLHGYSGNYKTWLGIKPNLPELADQYGVIFVMPDGKNSWYWDSPKDPAYRYETFLSKELVTYVDTHYPTIPDRSKRAITGLSMGGHGGLWTSIRNKPVFGAGGSTSGGVDIRPFPKNWEMSHQLGAYETNKEIWDSHTVYTLVDNLKNGELAIIFDCGYADFFFDVNNALHEKLLKAGIDHDYLVRPGGHDNDYWRNAIDYQILFFVKYFNKK
ncbi:MAG: esterase family protein [Tannerellaceae bacterium]|nr:esterase family protein [Tannerellaceae bacterium]